MATSLELCSQFGQSSLFAPKQAHHADQSIGLTVSNLQQLMRPLNWGLVAKKTTAADGSLHLSSCKSFDEINATTLFDFAWLKGESSRMGRLTALVSLSRVVNSRPMQSERSHFSTIGANQAREMP